jgi:hypothetical protein
VAKRNLKLVEPVAEHARKFQYEKHEVTEKGQVVGRVYRRRPLFETMASRCEISREEAQALRYYRERHELSHRSLTRSCLSPSIGSGRDYFGGLSPLSMRAKQEVQIMEDAAGLFIHSLRMVALDDLSFNKIAMERYGTQQITVGGRERIVPKSKQHTRRVRSEFYAALKCFMPAAQSFYVANFFVDLPTHMGQKRVISGSSPKPEAVAHIAPNHRRKVA